MSEPAVHIEGLGKRYRLGLTNADTVADWVTEIARGLRQVMPGRESPLTNASKKIENEYSQGRK